MASRRGVHWILALCAVAVLLVAGCGSSGSSSRTSYPVHPAATSSSSAAQTRTTAATTTAPAPAPAPAPAAATVAPPPARTTTAASNQCGSSVASRTYPAQGAVRLDVRAPSQVPMNTPFEYTIQVNNISDVVVGDVVVTERLPRNFRFERADPPASPRDGTLVWALGGMDPKTTVNLKIVGMAITSDCLMHCSTVDFVIPTCINIEVVEPKLVLTKTAPPAVVLCDPIPVNFVVTNSGTGDIPGVTVLDNLPPGLQTADGKTQISLDAGTLSAGQSKKYAVNLKAARTGEYINRAIATSSSGLKAEATTRTIVHQPVLAITKTGPERLFLGRPGTYQITVTNKGDAPAVDTIVEDTIPEGVQGVKASSGGSLSGSKIVWQLGTLAINASKTVSVTYTPSKGGTYTNVASAAAVCADAVTATVRTGVEGIAAVLLEVVDVEDPIEVGAQETYLITATNQGSAPDHNVQITCVLENAQEYVSSDGPTRATVEGRTVRFAPLNILPVGQKATWKVVVRALQEGDIRFQVIMNTQELGRSVEETEATRQY